MRIVFVSFEEPFFLPQFFDTVLTSHAQHVIACLIHPYRKNIFFSLKNLARTHSRYEIIKLMGVYFFRLLSLVVRGYPPLSVQSVMRKHGVQIIELKSLKGEGTKKILKGLAPDFVVSQTSELVSEKLLEIPKYGWFNKHASLLPKYRGLHPLFWALYYDEPTVGVTIYKMTNILDHGPILAQKKVLVPKNISIFNLYSRVFQAGAQLINQALSRPLRLTHSLNLDPTVYKTPNREQIRAFRKKGYSMV